MTWFTDPDNQAESVKPHSIQVIALDGDFPSGHLRLSTWLAPLEINGNTFTAAGNLIKIPENVENLQLTADTRSYQLSGVDPAAIPESEIDACFGRSFVEYLVWLDGATHQVIGWEISFEGRMDKVQRRDGGQPTIEVNAEHRLVILDGTDGWCYTDPHQKQFDANDTGLDQVQLAGSISINWGGGGVPAATTNPGSGGGGSTFGNFGHPTGGGGGGSPTGHFGGH